MRWIADFRISPDIKETALFLLGAVGLMIESLTPGSRESLVMVYAAMTTAAVGISSGRNLVLTRNGHSPPPPR